MGLVAFSVRFFSGLADLLLRRLGGSGTNQVTGEVQGDLIQVDTIHGDLTIHRTCRRCRERG